MSDQAQTHPDPPFVATVSGAPASFVQVAYLIDGHVRLFQQPLTADTPEAAAEALAKLKEEVAACPR